MEPIHINKAGLCQVIISEKTYHISPEIKGMSNGQKAGLAHFNGGKSYAFIALSSTPIEVRK